MSYFKGKKAKPWRALSEGLGFSGAQNIAAWLVAGTVAYYLWVRPGQQAEQLRQEDVARRREWAKAKGIEDVDRASPTPDPQVTGLLRAHRSKGDVQSES